MVRGESTRIAADIAGVSSTGCQICPRPDPESRQSPSETGEGGRIRTELTVPVVPLPRASRGAAAPLVDTEFVHVYKVWLGPRGRPLECCGTAVGCTSRKRTDFSRRTRPQGMDSRDEPETPDHQGGKRRCQRHTPKQILELETYALFFSFSVWFSFGVFKGAGGFGGGI